MFKQGTMDVGAKLEFRTKIYDFTLCYKNTDAATQTVEEIFFDKVYEFTATTSKPVIIDGGGNIGIATLYFKKLYPNSEIICFEPDPNAFHLLKKNIQINKLKKVKLVNAALIGSADEHIKFFGQVNGLESDSRGNSVIADWGVQRPEASSTTVLGKRLSKYITKPIDLLKLDIEGAEQSVLEECSSVLKNVKEIIMEVHCTPSISERNSLEGIRALLEGQGFECNIEQKYINAIFPPAAKEWLRKNRPTFYNIHAKNIF